MERDQDAIDQLKRDAGALLAQFVRSWNSDDIATVLGTDRSRVADLRYRRLARFSLEMLVTKGDSVPRLDRSPSY